MGPVEFGLLEGQTVSLEYEDGTQEEVEIQRTRFTNGLVGVVASPTDSADTYNIMFETAEADMDGGISKIAVYRSENLARPITADFVPELSTEVPYRWVVSLKQSDPNPVEIP